ncbi:MAG TPA: PQQ-binding-like beta-propeller repeat protein [Gemmataceae bacterium]|jgi:outer membrane protein assembly factor BamB|nr:PQQ-binding-like beta-propeller repeat protein [Gemmataceae bacterium]
MKAGNITMAAIIMGTFLLGSNIRAQDWPQWRGPNRDAKATGFTAPKDWPKELAQKWKVKVGEGVSTPALVGDKVYVFTRQGGNEVILCLDVSNGKEVWQDKYEAPTPTRPGSGFNNEFVGPRSSPAVAEGKVVTLGASGILSCLDVASGKVVWRKTDLKGHPMFFASCSPIIANGLCIVQIGGEDAGAIAAFDLADGKQKWKWTADGTAYASPILATIGDVKMIVAETAAKIVGVNAADGKLLWETPFPKAGRSYNACTPIAEGQTVIFSGTGRGTRAMKIEKQGDTYKATELWSNKENAVQFNTPVVKDGLVYGLTGSNNWFCISAESGKTAWTAAAPAAGGGGRMGGGYGSVVDAGAVLFGLTPAGKLTVFQPSDKESKVIATYTVASGDTYAYPVISGNRIFIKDKDSLTLWTIE